MTVQPTTTPRPGPALHRARRFVAARMSASSPGRDNTWTTCDCRVCSHAAILRSPHAHARVRGIDASAALALEGVVAVFTHADMAELMKPIPMRVFPLPGLDNYLQTPLSADIVRHAGEAVAVVVAESRYLAEGRAGRHRG